MVLDGGQTKTGPLRPHPHAGKRLLLPGNHLLHPAVKLAARLRHAHAVCRPRQQRHADLSLQRIDLCDDRLLGKMVLHLRLTKASLIRHCDKQG